MSKNLAKKWDTNLLIILAVLTVWGLVNFYSAALPLSQKNFGNQYHFLLQFFIKNVILGTLAFFVFTFFSWSTLRRLSFFLFLLSVVALLLAFSPAFRPADQTTARWLDLKFISFQPSEFIKLTLLLWLSFLLPQLQKVFKAPHQRSLTLLAVIGLVSVLIYLQPALSNLLIIWATIFAGYLSLKPTLRELSPFILLVVIFLVVSPLWSYRLQRILAHFERGYTQSEINFQKEQTKLAVGSGGILGRGVGKSKVKLIGIPLMITDSIFAIYAEETGFVGSILLIAVLLTLVLLIIKKPDNFSSSEKKFFAYGCATWICAQAFIHIASNVGLIPTTGVPLPFFSYGPSSQIALMSALGILANLENS